MSSTVVRTTIKADFASFMTANYPGVPVLDDPNNFRDRDTVFNEDPDVWVSMFFYVTDTMQASIGPPGSRTWREYGVVDITVFAPSGEGDAELLSMCEAIKSHFRGTTIGNVNCMAADGPTLAILSEAYASRGNWFGYSIDVEYRYDYCD